MLTRVFCNARSCFFSALDGCGAASRTRPFAAVVSLVFRYTALLAIRPATIATAAIIQRPQRLRGIFGDGDGVGVGDDVLLGVVVTADVFDA